MTPAEFLQLAAKLTELEDYLQDQRRAALAVGHPADAAVLEHALRLAIAVHAHAQLLLET